MIQEGNGYMNKQISNEAVNGEYPPKRHNNEVPIWERYTLTVEEAADYFRIGQKRIRQIIAEDPTADFVLMVGNRAQIKRKLFEEYVDVATAI